LISPLGGEKIEGERIETAPNVWKAVDDVDESEQFVVKEPSSDDDAALKWPAFQHELEMQKLFKNSPFIRRMVDFVPSSALVQPKIVLQGFEKTLWTARNRRTLTDNEIKWIMKAVLMGLWTVHKKGYVYSSASPFHMAQPNIDIYSRSKDGKRRSEWIRRWATRQFPFDHCQTS
jgi:hypothetical protein